MNSSALKSIIFLNSEVNIAIMEFLCPFGESSLKSVIIHKSALPTSHPCTSNIVEALTIYYTIISQEEVNSEYVKLRVELNEDSIGSDDIMLDDIIMDDFILDENDDDNDHETNDSDLDDMCDDEYGNEDYEDMS
jgi:hypothetical protein